MAEKAPKKRSVARAADGTRTVTYEGGLTYAYRLADYPQNVRDYFAELGMDTAHRNASIGSDADGSVGTPADMFKREAAKVAGWKAGVVRTIVAGEEKAAAPALVLEAASIYRAMSACFKATGGIDGWEGYERPEPESLRAEIEALDDVVTNPEAVEAAKAAAAGKPDATPETIEAAGVKATITRLDLLKANTIFKAAVEEAKEARAKAKRAALRASIAAQASADPAPM